MFVTYYSNQPEIQKDILVSLLENLPQDDPFQSDIVLVQSPGMAQWLQMEIAKNAVLQRISNSPCLPVLFGNFTPIICRMFLRKTPFEKIQRYGD